MEKCKPASKLGDRDVAGQKGSGSCELLVLEDDARWSDEPACVSLKVAILEIAVMRAFG